MKRKWLYSFGIVTLMCSTALSGIYIVCDDDGSNPSVTKDHVISVFEEANKVLRQVAMSLPITADQIQYINHSAWKNLSQTNSNYQQIRRDMGSVPRIGSLRIFFIDSLNGSNRIGLNGITSMLITKNASGATFAHEVCHVGGLRDIYPQRDGISITDAGVVKEEYFPQDWSGGYYPSGLLHTNLITRLLMYGYVGPSTIDIPLGRVHGVYRPMVNGQVQPPTKGMVPVGVQDLNRQPQHRDRD